MDRSTPASLSPSLPELILHISLGNHINETLELHYAPSAGGSGLSTLAAVYTERLAFLTQEITGSPVAEEYSARSLLKLASEILILMLTEASGQSQGFTDAIIRGDEVHQGLVTLAAA